VFKGLIRGSEAVSIALSKYYKEEFGSILHHNVDKGLVVGGEACPRFGGGEVTQPMYIVVAGRAVTEVLKSGELIPVPVGSLAMGAIKGFLKKNLRFLDVERHVMVDYKIKRGSRDLVKNFDAEIKMPLANDTSFGVGFAPLSETEQLTLETELFLNSSKLKKELPEVGEDVKVMGLRRGEEILLTVAVAMISSLTPDLDHYLNVKEEIADRIKGLATEYTERPVQVIVNAADQPDNEICYLTVTGTSAEQGDDGNTGRGNRVNGLITPCRPMSLEATAGKNPVSHVGKIYNVLAKKIANRVNGEVKGVREVYVKILAQIGQPLDKPAVTDIELLLHPGASMAGIKREAEAIAEDEVSRSVELTELILSGETRLF
jgi:S-adenosylmethionine synthetase